MRLAVPRYPSRPWQTDLGLVSELIRPRGEVRRLNKSQLRATLSVVYQVQVARLFAVEGTAGARLVRTRPSWPPLRPRAVTVRLNDLDVFAPEKPPDLTVHHGFGSFMAQVPPDRLLELVAWAPPVIAMNRRTGRARVYGNQLTTALARYRFPDRSVLARRYHGPPRRQLTFRDVASLVVFVFGGFVDRNADLVCRLSGTAAEAALLIGKSINTAAVIRKRLGVLTP